MGQGLNTDAEVTLYNIYKVGIQGRDAVLSRKEGRGARRRVVITMPQRRAGGQEICRFLSLILPVFFIAVG